MYEVKVLRSNEFWGRRRGTYVAAPPKGGNRPWGNVINQVSWAKAKAGRSTKQSSCTLLNVNKKWFK